jgi:hypothetical protein
MTRAKDRTADTADQQDQSRREAPAESQELDAEIVRDLEIDEHGDEVRGGGCASSHMGVVCQPQ